MEDRIRILQVGFTFDGYFRFFDSAPLPSE